MTVESKRRDLFTVDNSVSGWTALRDLEEWTTIAKGSDIATRYFLFREMSTAAAVHILDSRHSNVDR